MIDNSATVTNVPVQVAPPVAERNTLILYAPGASIASGGSGDIIYSFTLTGAALVPGAPGTLYLQGGQTMTFGGQPGVFAPPDAIWAVAAHGNSAPLTVLTM